MYIHACARTRREPSGRTSDPRLLASTSSHVIASTMRTVILHNYKGHETNNISTSVNDNVHVHATFTPEQERMIMEHAYKECVADVGHSAAALQSYPQATHHPQRRNLG